MNKILLLLLLTLTGVKAQECENLWNSPESGHFETTFRVRAVINEIWGNRKTAYITYLDVYTEIEGNLKSIDLRGDYIVGFPDIKTHTPFYVKDTLLVATNTFFIKEINHCNTKFQ